jgi:hypothetical protein
VVAISASSSTSIHPQKVPHFALPWLTISHRLRRIKCGEERPACARCVKSGWKCDGYADTKTPALAAATAAKSLTGAVPNMFLSPPAPWGNEKELAVGTAKEEGDRTITG